MYSPWKWDQSDTINNTCCLPSCFQFYGVVSRISKRRRNAYWYNLHTRRVLIVYWLRSCCWRARVCMCVCECVCVCVFASSSESNCYLAKVIMQSKHAKNRNFTKFVRNLRKSQEQCTGRQLHGLPTLTELIICRPLSAFRMHACYGGSHLEQQTWQWLAYGLNYWSSRRDRARDELVFMIAGKRCSC